MTNISPKKIGKDPKPSPIPLPGDQTIKKLASLLISQNIKDNQNKHYAKVKDILALIGAGAVISATLLAPGSTNALLPFLKKSPDWDKWKHFNEAYLRRTLRRLESQKIIERSAIDNQSVLTLTKNGKRKILKYNLDNLKIEKPSKWDRKWRLVLYDVPTRDKTLGDIIREALQTMNFYAIQDSVYIYPYSCFEQIEFLREFYALGDKVQYMLVAQIEHDDEYKTFFNLS